MFPPPPQLFRRILTDLPEGAGAGECVRQAGLRAVREDLAPDHRLVRPQARHGLQLGQRPRREVQGQLQV